MPKVHLPDGRVVNFPYTMSLEQIEAAIPALTGDGGSIGPESGFPGKALFEAQAPMSGMPTPRGIAGLVSKAPLGRLLTTGAAATKAGASRIPFIGAPVSAALRAGTRAWKSSAPTIKTATARPETASISERLILSPAEAAAQAQVERLAQMEARRRGLLSASGQASKAWPR